MGYGLFQAEPDSPDLTIELAKGPTLVIGANGLGKTTLIYIIFRLLTGPSDLSRRGGMDRMGNVEPEPVPLDRAVVETFRRRVADGAESAKAGLTFSIGP